MYNNTTHRVTKFTPAQLYYNRNQNIPIDMNTPVTLIPNDDQSSYVNKQQKLMRQIKKYVLQVQEEMYVNTKEYTKPAPSRKIELGSQVYLKSLTPPQALQPKFIGPYTVTKMLRNNNVIIELNTDKTTKKIHIDHLYLQKSP